MKIDTAWTLFLDRDGVINRRLPGDYVRFWDEFQFEPGALEAIAELGKRFGYLVVVTNQAGVEKGIMTAEAVEEVHRLMQEAIRQAGGRLDAIYYCPQRPSTPNNCRKPSPAMALQAQRDLPGIHFSRSVMVGDSVSDMEFGFELGMKTALIPDKPEEREGYALLAPRIDWICNSLADFAGQLQGKNWVL